MFSPWLLGYNYIEDVSMILEGKILWFRGGKSKILNVLISG